MTRLRAAAPLLAAAALAVVAVVTVQGAGCADPGRYVATSDGYELVGGCVTAQDVMVPVAENVTVPDAGAVVGEPGSHTTKLPLDRG